MRIHDTALIERGAVIGNNVEIGPYSIIRGNAKIGDDSFIGSHCDIGFGDDRNLVIGDNSLIRSHSVLYGGSEFIQMLETGHHVTLREGINAGKNLRIGTSSTLQHNIKIGNYVRMHSNVHISNNTFIGDFVWIFPFTNTTNDPHPPSSITLNVKINDFAVLATNSLILPGVEIGKGCLIGAGSKVSSSTEDNYLYSGNPAKRICHVSKIRLKDDSKRSAYPWKNHYQKGYPEEISKMWNLQK